MYSSTKRVSMLLHQHLPARWKLHIADISSYPVYKAPGVLVMKDRKGVRECNIATARSLLVKLGSCIKPIMRNYKPN
jgi:hypothetical protein